MQVKVDLICTRHPAAVAFCQRALGSTVPVFTGNVTGEVVKDKVVAGVLPLHLAAQASMVLAIEFAGAPPRGQEYDLAAMDAAGAKLVAYSVKAV